MMVVREVGEGVLEGFAGTHCVFRYHTQPASDRDHAPRPFFHPVYTLRGCVITDYLPADHTWHHGISLAIPLVNQTSLWGGPTYIHGQGYVPLANHGSAEHLSHEINGNTVIEQSRWRDPAGVTLLYETRTFTAVVLNDHVWSLTLESNLRPAVDTVTFSSPGATGRMGAGYGGWFWRGADWFRGGVVHTEQHTGEAQVLGTCSAWLDFTSADGTVSLKFEDLSSTEPFPWFVRSQEYAGVCFATAFDQPCVLPADGLRLRHRITVRDV